MIEIKTYNDNFWVKADILSDKAPVWSTFTNLANIILKIGMKILNMNLPSETYYSSYRVHLYNKSLAKCVCLLLPAIGNLAVYLYEKSFIINNINDLSKRYKREGADAFKYLDLSVVLDSQGVLNRKALNDIFKIHKKNYNFLQYFPENWRAHFDIVSEAINLQPFSLFMAIPELRSNRELIKQAIEKEPQVYFDLPAFYDENEHELAKFYFKKQILHKCENKGNQKVNVTIALTHLGGSELNVHKKLNEIAIDLRLVYNDKFVTEEQLDKMIDQKFSVV